nr:helix-turn-helix domain-containing protein [Pelagibacterium xiamenense]
MTGRLSVFSAEGLRPPHGSATGPGRTTIPLTSTLIGVFKRLAAAAFEAGGAKDSWLRFAVLSALGEALGIGQSVRKDPDRRPLASGYGLAQKVVRHIENRFGQKVSVTDIASELGVTPRALHYAVRSIFGISPFELILAFRLGHVRKELWDRRFHEHGITRAAMTQDFGHLGRFSQQYRFLYGELPSETLDRIRRLAGT